MSIAIESINYENEVIKSINKVGVQGEIIKPSQYGSQYYDADLKINDKIYYVEIKKNNHAQMGGTSINYNPDENFIETKFEILSNTIEYDSFCIMREMLQEKEDHIKNLVNFLVEYKNEDWEYENDWYINVAKKINGFPLTTTKCAWSKAKENGLLKPINGYINADEKFIARHYNKKNVYYIQIGELGLFYLGENPANLPIPPLCGNISLEIRAGRAGSRVYSDTPKSIRVVFASLRIQGRLQYIGKSKYTLDDPKSIKQMMSKREKQQNVVI